MQGFAPADEVLLFRQQDPKPFPPVRGPPGPSASAPNTMAQELAPLKQPSPKKSIRGCGSGAPNARTISARKGKRRFLAPFLFPFLFHPIP